ncbi:hypothetical protein FQA39_LY05007 [Lamprigera yunnana]|nr:hypothetical protein FQA39_LY05007 [Lamprigera yunnana]
MSKQEPIFRELRADDPNPEITRIESLCMNCQADGITQLLLTKIPFFKEVVIMSFSCEECGYANNEIQPGGEIPAKGVKITLNVETPKDLNRQVVKSDYASVNIEELDFEIPSRSQKGGVTTIESIIDRSIAGLERDQPLRKIENVELADQIDEFIDRLKKLKEVETPFTIVLEDISGNSFIENPNAPSKDESCTVSHFVRTKEQDEEIGIFRAAEVVIMATVCESCGNRTNEVKSGTGIEPKGVRIEIDVKTKEDLCRDLLKSETCHLSIPQLQLDVGPHALGGRFTTVEGILMAIKVQLSENVFQDSQTPESKEKFSQFLQHFDEIIQGTMTVTLVLDDPAGNSYTQSLGDDDKPDERLRITSYERSFEQNEELGLNDMKTENY